MRYPARSLPKSVLALRRVRAAGEGPFSIFTRLITISRAAVTGFREEYMDGVPVNDLGWENLSAGHCAMCKGIVRVGKAAHIHHENGLATTRIPFAADISGSISKRCARAACRRERYYHWCFTDNFEWLEGNSRVSGWFTWTTPRKNGRSSAAASFSRR